MPGQGVLALTRWRENVSSRTQLHKAYFSRGQGISQWSQLPEWHPDQRKCQRLFRLWARSIDSIESPLGGATAMAQDDEQCTYFPQDVIAVTRDVSEAKTSPLLIDVYLIGEYWLRNVAATAEEDPLSHYMAFVAEAYSLFDENRMTCSSGQLSDVDRDLSCGIVELGDSDPPSSEKLWAIARDLDEPVEKRVDALYQLAALEEQTVAHYVVDELCGDDIPSDWRNALIQFAEHCQFEDNTHRARLKGRLLEYADRLRQSTEAGIKYVVYSAIRTYASLISFAEASSLLKLLEPPNPVETRLVTLHCIVHLFEKKPPQDKGLLRAMADRVHELAMKFLDRDWLVPGEKAAIGQCATQALAALGDMRLEKCVEKIKKLGKPWVTRQVAQKLEVLLASWEANSDARGSDAYALIRQQLDVLRS